MSSKKIVSIIGIIVGIAIVIIGFFVLGGTYHSAYTPDIGRPIKFGADFYTEMYSVTQDVGEAINANTTALSFVISDICNSIGWLIVSIGAIDICFFSYKLAKSSKPIENTTIAKPSAPIENTTTTQNTNTNNNTPENPTNTSPIRKATQCECGELFYGRYCPVCGKSAKVQTKTRPIADTVLETQSVTAPVEEMPSISNPITETPSVKTTNKSSLCKCGERFYGDVCPNCGRLKDI